MYFTSKETDLVGVYFKVFGEAKVVYMNKIEEYISFVRSKKTLYLAVF